MSDDAPKLTPTPKPKAAEKPARQFRRKPPEPLEAPAIARRIEERVLEIGGGSVRDDVAVVVLRVSESAITPFAGVCPVRKATKSAGGHLGVDETRHAR